MVRQLGQSAGGAINVIEPPALRRKFVKDGDTRGINAKAVSPPMPASEGTKVFARIQAGLLNARSIGWLPTKAHFADESSPP